MPEIIQGDHGTVMEMIISDHNGIIDIRGSTIEVTVQTSTRKFVKQGVVTDGLQGKAEFTLNSDDVQDEGIYVFQCQVNFPSGSNFSSNIQRFTVGRKL